MAFYRVANTFNDPGVSQSGFAEPGAGAQYSGDTGIPIPEPVDTYPKRPAKGLLSWLNPGGARGGQQGFAPPENPLQERPPGSMPNVPPIFGGTGMLYTPPYSRGAAAYVPQTGKLLTNPIGAGIVALSRPQASYGGAAQYANGALWWTSQVIPTSLGLQGLTSPEVLSAQLGMLNVQAVVRTTG